MILQHNAAEISLRRKPRWGVEESVLRKNKIKSNLSDWHKRYALLSPNNEVFRSWFTERVEIY